MDSQVKWVALKKYIELTGDNPEDVRARREEGKWLDGRECMTIEGNLWINLQETEKWFSRCAQEQAQAAAPSPLDIERVQIEADLIERLANGIAQHLQPSIPLSIDLWDIVIIAHYFKRNPATVRERLSCLPSFPKAIRMPTTKGKSRPLYKATEVIKWAERYRDKN